MEAYKSTKNSACSSDWWCNSEGAAGQAAIGELINNIPLDLLLSLVV